MKRNPYACRLGCDGFTLIEVVVASAITLTVMTVAMAVFINIYKVWNGINLRIQADRDVNIAMSRMVYGMGNRYGIRSASEVTLTSRTDGWTLVYPTGGATPQTNSFTYSATAKNLVFNPGSLIAGKNISSALATVNAHAVVITLRVDRVDGKMQVQRALGTEITWRN